jgi:hypothetical protein
MTTRDYRAFVGPADAYDVVGAVQFSLLAHLGLREHHYLLDVGCGSLRVGRLLIPYLLPGRYFGIEPQAWLVQEGIAREVGADLVCLKRPAFRHEEDCSLTAFGREFDFILAHSIFSHASQGQIRRCVGEAAEVMGPTSLFVATFMPGSSDYEGDEWVYPACVRYRPEYIGRIAQESGLACRRLDWPHPNRQQWILMTKPGHEAEAPDLDGVSHLAHLQNRLRECEGRLARMDGHPYVRFGRAIRNLIGKLRA